MTFIIILHQVCQTIAKCPLAKIKIKRDRGKQTRSRFFNLLFTLFIIYCFFQVSRWDDVKVIIAALLLTLVAVLVVLVKYFIEYEEVSD